MDEDKNLVRKTCPACGANVIAQVRFCAKCGFEMDTVTQGTTAMKSEAQLDVQKMQEIEPKERPIAENVKKIEIPAVVEVKYAEPENLFAKELPEWSIEPPMVVIRRKKS